MNLMYRCKYKANAAVAEGNENHEDINRQIFMDIIRW
jgi:hypothetical protein